MTAREALIFGRVVSLDLSSDTVQQELGVCPVMAGGKRSAILARLYLYR